MRHPYYFARAFFYVAFEHFIKFKELTLHAILSQFFHSDAHSFGFSPYLFSLRIQFVLLRKRFLLNQLIPKTFNAHVFGSNLQFFSKDLTTKKSILADLRKIVGTVTLWKHVLTHTRRLPE